MKKAFTLVELLMVIAIIAIISTLAVSKVSGLKEKSALQTSIVNQKEIARAVEAFLAAGGKLNYLDGLTYASTVGGGDGGGGQGFMLREMLIPGRVTGASGMPYAGPADDIAARDGVNAGLMPSLYAPGSYCCRYSLSSGEVTGFRNILGLTYLMRHYPKAAGAPRDNGFSVMADGSSCPAADGVGLDANRSACIVNAVTNGMYVLAIAPNNNYGRSVYRAFGQRLTERDSGVYDDAEVLREVKATGGPLIVFGLGDEASIVGSAQAGIDSAPVSTFNLQRHYSRFLLVFRLRSYGTGPAAMSSVEFAGVLDPVGNTIAAAQTVLDEL